MEHSKALRLLTASVFFVAMLPCGNGCGINPQPPADTPPDIPPSGTFVMDFDDFSGAGGAKRVIDRSDSTPLQAQAGDNWQWAALHVGVWSVIITVGLAVPVAAFLESFNHTPEQQEDGAWVWSYEVPIGGVAHFAELHALADDGDIQWRMIITKEGYYEDFEWFTGVSNLIGTEGTWTLNKSPDDPTPFIGIEWHRDADAETGDLRYTNIVPNGPENGGYIFHGTTGGPDSAFFEIYNKGQDALRNVEWNRTTKEGRVRDQQRFGDDAWHCWDSGLQDIECP